MRRWPYGNETFDVDALSGEIQSWEHGAKESPGCSPDGGEIRVDDQVAFVPAAFIGAYFDDHVGTGVVHREVLSGGEGSVLGRYPVGGWAEVPRPLSSKASGPVVAWCVGGGGSHVACGFGDGTVEADRRDSGGADGASDDDDDDASDDEGAESDLAVARVAWARARTLAVCYAAKSDDARLDDDGEDDDASWALAFAGEALLAVSPAFRCTVFRPLARGPRRRSSTGRGAAARRGVLARAAARRGRGVVALAGAKSVDVFRAADFRDRRRRQRRWRRWRRASLVRGDAVGAAALVWDRVHALCLDSSGALREAGATFATVWAGAHFPVGYELLLDNVHYAECEDELDFCGGVEQLPTYETDLRTVDGFFAVSMDDEELSDGSSTSSGRAAQSRRRGPTRAR
ncbi:hypothetical protein JL720_4205 [Aureococcus anophagefferens]|nr:hypothetical protein JL720_4205 [Aureococcus anophagefferens]